MNGSVTPPSGKKRKANPEEESGIVATPPTVVRVVPGIQPLTVTARSQNLYPPLPESDRTPTVPSWSTIAGQGQRTENHSVVSQAQGQSNTDTR